MKLKLAGKYVRRIMKLSPMHQMLRCLKKYDVTPAKLSSLEVFGCIGNVHTMDLASIVNDLEIWEINPEYEVHLKRRFPKSEIKITDSYEEIKRCSKKFDLVVVDNPSVAKDHYEHFDLFPHIFEILNNVAIIILIVMPKISLYSSDEWLKKRRSFYNSTSQNNIYLNEMEKKYINLAEQNGWHVNKLFFLSRSFFSKRKNTIYYAFMLLSKDIIIHPKSASINKGMLKIAMLYLLLNLILFFLWKITYV